MNGVSCCQNKTSRRRVEYGNLLLLFAILIMGPATSTTSEALASSSSSSPQRTGKANGFNGKRNGFKKPSLVNGYRNNLLQGMVEESQFVDHRLAVDYIADTKLPTDIGQFKMRAYRIQRQDGESEAYDSHDPLYHGNEPVVIYCADKPPFGRDGELAEKVPVRIHDQCLTSEVFRSQRCDCKEQLVLSLEYIAKNGGAIIYLQQEGRGIGLANKVAAYQLQDMGMDTVDANLHLGFPEDNRKYGVVPSLLEDMNIGSIQLLTNNPRKVERLEHLGVKIEGTVPVVVPKAGEYNRKYLETKQERMNHSNLSGILSSKSTKSNGFHKRNGIMAPRKTIPNYVKPVGGDIQQSNIHSVNDENTTNGVHVSVVLGDDETAHDDVYDENSKAGVVAEDDGYCFGKKSVEAAIAAIARGEMVVVVDDMDRENEGDLIIAADKCTDMAMAQIVRYSSGVVCVAMEGERMDELKLPSMVDKNEDPKGTAFSVTVDASKEHGITTGISAADRAKTVQLLADPTTTSTDFNRPGHLFPLRAREGGVLTRDGHTEAAIDLSRLAGLNPCGVLCEIVSEDNPTEMMRLPELKRFAKRHGLVLTSIADLAQYRNDMES